MDCTVATGMGERRITGLLALVITGVLLCSDAVSAGERADRRAKRVEAILHDLASDDPATVARAAYEAGGLYRSRTDLVPALLEAPTRDIWAKAAHGSRAIKHLLDALIRLDAEVPMAVLGRHEEPVYTATESLILAARNGDSAHPMLRRVLQRAIEGQQIEIAGVAAGNILATARDRSFAALFLPHLQPSVLVTVFDHDRLEGGSLRVAVGTGCARCKIPEGFPPAVWYVLSFSGRDWQRTLVAKGAVKSVWYVRHEESRREFFRCHSSRKRDATEVGLGWIATLLGVRREDLTAKPRYYRTHRWSTADAYRAHMRGVRAEIQREIGALLDRLVEAHLLSAEDRRKVAIDPVFEIEDDRDDQRVPLAKIEGTRER